MKKASSLRGTGLAAAVGLAGALAIGAVRQPAVDQHEAVKETTEAFLLPPPEQLKVFSLGYRAALADYLWAHVLVTQGLRLGERRRFATILEFLDAIVTLDPDFREPYLLADTLTTIQAVSATVEEVRGVRKLLERGTRQFPDDAQIWLTAGEFITYVAPGSYLKELPEEAARWRVEGVTFLQRAGELGSADGFVAARALGGGRSLLRAGEREAAIRFYRKALSTLEDPELREQVEAMLIKLDGERAVQAHRARARRFEEDWRRAYPSWSLTGVFAAGPPFDPAACAGGSVAPAASSSLCATRWSDWAARVDAAIELDAAGVEFAPPSP